MAAAATAIALSLAAGQGRARAESALELAARAAEPAVVGIVIVRDGQPTSTASGVAIDTLGDVVTGAEAVADARALRVVLSDARTLPARLRGIDPHSGVAVVQLERPPRDLAVARFADSDLVEVGEPMLAIARRADGAPSIGRGLVNRRHREARATPVSAAMGGRDSFSTDLPLDAENPGGALVNRDGEVVALAVGAQGLPINRVRRVAQMILVRGEARYPYLGVLLIDESASEGAVVSRVVAGAPADRAGLRAGDVITALDHLEMHAADEILERVSDHDVGEHVTIGFVRGGEPRSVQVGLDALPPPASARASATASLPHVRTSWVISAGAPSRIGGPQ
jgi:putative serine protease PepD